MPRAVNADVIVPFFSVAPFAEDSDEQYRRLAKIVKEFLEEKNWPQESLAETYNEIACKEYPNSGVTEMWREHVSRILGHLKEGKASRRLHRLHRRVEWEILAKAMEMSPEFLLGLNTAIDTSDPRENARHAELLASAMARCQQDTQGVIGWAEFLPCSLVPHSFMAGHHKGLYLGNLEVEKQWNTIGKKRRDNLMMEGRNRKWLLRHLMFRSDLEKIAQGKGAFRHISPEVRKECFLELIKMLADLGWKIQLLVAEDRPALRESCLTYDSIVAFGNRLILLRDFMGISYYSEEPWAIYQTLSFLEQFAKDADFTKPSAVVTMLEEIVKQYL